VNLLAGKEFNINAKNTIGIGFKVTRAGGKRYGLVDVAATNEAKEILFLDSEFNESQFPDYFRLDLKISWRKNAEKVTHEIGLDLVNLLNTENLLSITYNPAILPEDLANPNYKPYSENKQLGFLPIFYYKIDFKVARGQ
jgi:hypothetical protein